MNTAEKTIILGKIEEARQEVRHIKGGLNTILELDLNALEQLADLRLQFEEVLELTKELAEGIRNYRRTEDLSVLSPIEEKVRKEVTRIRKEVMGL